VWSASCPGPFNPKKGIPEYKKAKVGWSILATFILFSLKSVSWFKIHRQLGDFISIVSLFKERSGLKIACLCTVFNFHRLKMYLSHITNRS